MFWLSVKQGQLIDLTEEESSEGGGEAVESNASNQLLLDNDHVAIASGDGTVDQRFLVCFKAEFLNRTEQAVLEVAFLVSPTSNKK
jgi:hypothetical protein